VTWVKPACDGSSPVTKYSITSPTNPQGVPRVRSVTNPLASTRYSISFGALNACTVYAVTITAINAAGSSAPTEVSAQTIGC
jgi:hypothetical protein